MRIFVNSREQAVPDGASVAALIELLGMAQKQLAVEVNTDLVPKREWPLFKLKAEDRVEVVSFVGGG